MWGLLVMLLLGFGIVGAIDYQAECGQSAECSAK
jgi:hypothetical protein